jgi:hypothetical protein
MPDQGAQRFLAVKAGLGHPMLGTAVRHGAPVVDPTAFDRNQQVVRLFQNASPNGRPAQQEGNVRISNADVCILNAAA